MQEFSKRLFELRKKTGLNQSDFGDMGGVEKDTQSNYENGKRKPDAAYLMGLLSHGIDVLYLLTGVRSKDEEITPEEQALLDNYRNADEEGQRAARKILDALAQQETSVKKRA